MKRGRSLPAVPKGGNVFIVHLVWKDPGSAHSVFSDARDMHVTSTVVPEHFSVSGLEEDVTGTAVRLHDTKATSAERHRRAGQWLPAPSASGAIFAV